MINGQIVTENFEVPEPPHDLSIKEITHEGYTLRIRKSCGSVTGCIITSSSFFENQTVSKEIFFNEIEKEIIVNDLKAAHPYSVSVVFTTKVGVTQPCKEPMKMMTAPSSPPQDVRPIHLTTDSIMVSWSPPAVVGEGIETSSLRYMVKLRGKDGREEKIQTNGLNTSFHGLLDARQYQVEVKAIVTEQNTSKPVSESLPTVCDIYTNPLPPRVLPPLPVDVQQFAITIKWEGPRLVAPHAVILHYILEFGAMDEDGFEPITGNKHELVTNDSLAMVTGLAQGQLYFFRTKVVTSLGNSDFSQPVLQQTKLNQTKYEGLESKIIKVQGDLESKILKVEGEQPPIGSIISWRGSKFSGSEVPPGWQRCDGSPISRGPLKGLGLHTPDLNGEGRFLRGGSDHQVGQLEDDSVEDHTHEIKDSGHTHQDNGHTHIQAPHNHWLDETGNSHAPGFVSRSCSSNVAGYLLTKHQYPADCMNVNSYTAKEQPSIHTGHASIKSSTSGVKIGKMGGAKSGGETRPKNMRTVFIMRVE